MPAGGLSSLLEPVTLKKGGRVRMQEGGGLPALGSFIPENNDWASVYSWNRGAPRPDLYGQTVDERMLTARDFFGGLSPEIQRAATEAAFQPRDFGYSIGGGSATGSVEQWRRDVADKMGVLQGLLGDSEYGDISGVLQQYAASQRPPVGGFGGASEREVRQAQHRDKQIVASDKLAYLLDQQRLSGQQAAEEAAQQQQQQQQQQEEQAAADAATQQQQQQAAAQQVLDDATLQNIQDQRVQDAQDAATMQTAAAAQPAAEQALNRPAPQLPQYRGYTPMQYDASRTGALTDWYARMLNVPVAQPFMAQSQIQGPDPDRSIFGLSSMLDPVTFRKGGRVGFNNGGITSFQEALTALGQQAYNDLIDQGKSHDEAVGSLERMERNGAAFLPNQKMAIFNSESNSPFMTENPSWKRTNERYGGRVGRMGGGMMIIEDNDVVNNGIGGILSKYKEIRSEL